MNLIQTLNKLRQDIQTWVSNNIRAVIQKLRDHESDSEAHQDIRDSIVRDYNELANAPDIREDHSGAVLYTDEDGNIIARVDDSGLETTRINTKSIALKESVDLTLSGDAEGVGQFNGSDVTISVEEKALKDIKGKFVTKTVGGVNKGTTINTDSVEELIKTLLGVQDGVAPASSSFSFTLVPTSITPALGTTSYSDIDAVWTINDSTTTYNGNYTPTIGGILGTATPLNASTKKATGTIQGLYVSFGDADTSVSIDGTASYEAEDGFEAGRLLATKALTINRACYYGTESTLSTTNRSTKNGWSINVTLNNEKAVFQYPKVWGALKKITDANEFDVTEAFERTVITKNGGNYYCYTLTSPNTGDFTYKLS